MRMARRTYNGAFHHGMNRGYEGRQIFRDDLDRNKFPELLEKVQHVTRIRILVHWGQVTKTSWWYQIQIVTFYTYIVWFLFDLYRLYDITPVIFLKFGFHLNGNSLTHKITRLIFGVKYKFIGSDKTGSQ